jgi:hypothetical protein
MKTSCHSFFPSDKSGLIIISLNPVEIVQYIKTDEITLNDFLKNDIILIRGKDLRNNYYYIKEWKYDEDKKELLFVEEKNA